MIKLDDGSVIEDRRKDDNGVGIKLLFVFIGILATSLAFLIPKWINPIESKVEALELDYRDYVKIAADKEVDFVSRISKVEEGFVSLNSRLERMDNKIDKLLERSFRQSNERVRAPYTSEAS